MFIFSEQPELGEEKQLRNLPRQGRHTHRAALELFPSVPRTAPEFGEARAAPVPSTAPEFGDCGDCPGQGREIPGQGREIPGQDREIPGQDWTGKSRDRTGQGNPGTGQGNLHLPAEGREGGTDPSTEPSPPRVWPLLAQPFLARKRTLAELFSSA